jgi:hypothetical protein
LKRGTLSASQHLSDIAQLGAGDGDMSDIHKSRINLTVQWMSDASTDYILPCMETVCGKLDDIEYDWFGQNKTGGVTLGQFLDRDTSPITNMMYAMLELGSRFVPEADGPWSLLANCSRANFMDERVKLSARQMIVLVACGLHVHYDIKYSEMPYPLTRVLNPQFSESEIDLVFDNLLAARDCDIGMFAKGFRNNFQTKESMKSLLARAVIRMFEKIKKFTTHASERGHAQERNLLASTGTGKAFAHHVRVDYLLKAKKRHMGANGFDPCKPVAATVADVSKELSVDN